MCRQTHTVWPCLACVSLLILGACTPTPPAKYVPVDPQDEARFIELAIQKSQAEGVDTDLYFVERVMQEEDGDWSVLFKRKEPTEFLGADHFSVPSADGEIHLLGGR